MSLKGFMISVILGLLLAIVSIWNFRIALYGIGIFYIIKAGLQLTNKEHYKKFQRMINEDRYKAYEKKSAEFKKYIKPDPISDFIIAFLFIYVGYKTNIAEGGIKYSLMMFLFVSIDYLIDTSAMVKSEKWEDYKKKSIFTSIIIVFIVFFLLK